MVVKDGRTGFMMHANGGYTFSWADIELNQWYYAEGVYDGETIRFYLVGELAAMGPTPVAPWRFHPMRPPTTW